MVYRGKPSKGCQTCRERKIRCDQRADGCRNCAKSGRDCPGYRNPTDLMFFDESDIVKGKVEARSNTSHSGSPHPSSRGSAGPSKIEPEPEKLSILRLSPALGDIAVKFFVEHYAVQDEAAGEVRTRRLLETISGVAGEAALSVIHAIGLAGMSRSGGDVELMQHSRRRYLTAIQKTNFALTLPDQVKQDHTLLAVMMLCLYEATSGGPETSLAAWSNHARGAAALLTARGSEQFTSVQRLRMFRLATLSVVSNCMQYSIPLPEQLLLLAEEASQYVDARDKPWALFRVYLEFADFMIKVKRKTIYDPHIIFERATALDKIFWSLLEDPGPGLRSEKVTVHDDPENVPGGYYYVFESYFAAQYGNAGRSARVILNQLARSILLLGMSSRPPVFRGDGYGQQLQTATENLYRLQEEAFASVPQHMGYTSRHDANHPTPQFLWSNFTTGQTPMKAKLPSSGDGLPFLRPLGGYSLPWLLFIIGDCDIATDEVHERANYFLRLIGQGMAVQQSSSLADILASRAMGLPWFRCRSGLDQADRVAQQNDPIAV